VAIKKNPTKIAAERELGRIADICLAKLKMPHAQLGFFLLADAAMERLRKAHLPKHAKPLDVLSFPEPKQFPHPEEKRGKVLGEIYLNWSLLKSDPERLRFLFIHGLLHLAGFTHAGKSDTMKMEKQERKLLASIPTLSPHAIKSRYRN